MEKELIETTQVLSPIIIGLITMFSGLTSGLIAIYLGPKIKFKYEDKKRKVEYKIETIKNIRRMLDNTTKIEEIQASSYWGFILENLSEEERKEFFTNAIIISNGQNSTYIHKKGTITQMLTRKEKEWELFN
ncbi:hypothetical protein LPB137_12090 [Poseidonibacter parvus]|uniref:Uncharacterized protein n=1 Tax=Poseidonibacter parvus TaxID=1850254 RepID=A0A1P8KPR9_9BACT|nr:hypothetical protein [Poseidonibacter parvus]APW66537.1 hypothetical protein LPB137_12090 [Poseidonibacter parvus]